MSVTVHITRTITCDRCRAPEVVEEVHDGKKQDLPPKTFVAFAFFAVPAIDGHLCPGCLKAFNLFMEEGG